MRQLLHFLFETGRSFDENDSWAYASHVALSSLLAIFPFMIFVTSLAAMLGYNNLENVITAIVLAPGQKMPQNRSSMKLS